MAFHCLDDAMLPLNSAAVAIDKDKNSQSAVRWTVDHLLTTTQLLILVHLCTDSAILDLPPTTRTCLIVPKMIILNSCAPNSAVPGSGDSSGVVSTDAEVQQLFVPCRGYCARKSVQLKEVVLDDVDVCKALVDYINTNFITNIVVGASSRNALLKLVSRSPS
ncbi:hypothetical protein Ancab_001985 [Ancistrocladus abbreviatus]